MLSHLQPLSFKFILSNFICFIFLVCTLPSFSQVPIGYWQEHLNYQHTKQVVKGNKIYAATDNSVFSIDAENDIEKYSKVNSLNDIGVNAIGWDDVSQQLVIAYANSNVDVLKNNNIKNINDIKRSTVSGNKTIFNIFCNNKIAYLCCGLGIIVVDLEKYEIKDTWIIGNNGNQVAVTAITADANFWYAATPEGLKRAYKNSGSLSNYNNWLNISANNGLSDGAVTNVFSCNNQIVIQKKDSIFMQNGNIYQLLYADINWPIVSSNSSENKILICQQTNLGNSRVLQLNINGTIEKTLAQPTVISFPKWATINNGEVWIADYYGGLSKYNNGFIQYIPNGPFGNVSGQMIFQDKTLYATAGSVNYAWNYQYNRDGIFKFQDGEWSYKGYYNQPIFDSVFDFIALASDPTNKSIWAGSYGGGLVNINGNSIKIYKQNNSTLQPAIGDATSYRVSGLAFDGNNNLWISNYAAPQNLQVLTANKVFKAITIPFTHFENAISQIVTDDANQIWIVSPRGNGVFCYNYGKSVDAINDDQWKYYRTGIGTGNLPSNNVFCAAKDKNGLIWIGTDKGIGVIQCPTETFVRHCDAIRPIIQQDRFAGYLFQDETVQAIAIDGANRKWVGTKNGLWLISADGDKIIYRFTEENSPLFSNDIKQIAIHPITGEIFIATFKGICSFRSTATEPNSNNNNILVFPNPVEPNYAGTIAISGLVNNATVKIAELNGRLVFQTKALGGQAVWNKRNYKNEKVASGVFLIIVTDDEGLEKIISKIILL